MQPWLRSALAVLILMPGIAPASETKIVFLPGKGSHGYGSHAFVAGSHLLAGLLNRNLPRVRAVVQEGGWPEDPAPLHGASAIVVFCDANSVMGNHYPAADALAEKGVGFAFLHYALDVGNKERGEYLLRWIGSYYEQHWSVNPSWKADFTALPAHPITRGVRPFAIHDEWYYHMRFADGMSGVTPLLTAIPPDKTRERPDGPHSNNPTVRSRRGMPEHVAWAFQRPGGGRGFGFTGGHLHWNWANDDYRTLVLNAIAWVAGIEVPEAGLRTPSPSPEDLTAHLHGDPPKDWSPDRLAKTIETIRSGK